MVSLLFLQAASDIRCVGLEVDVETSLTPVLVIENLLQRVLGAHWPDRDAKYSKNRSGDADLGFQGLCCPIVSSREG